MVCDYKKHNSISVSIIIVNYNTVDLVLQCLNSIYVNCKQDNFEIIVVDNASHDGSTEAIKNNYPNVILVENTRNEGFSKANNTAITLARGTYLLLLNSDTIVLPGALELLVQFLDVRNDVAAVGPKLLNADMSLQRSWFDFPSSLKTFCNITGLSKVLYRFAKAFSKLSFIFYHNKPAFMITNVIEPMRVDYLILACLLIRRELIDELGMLDENLFFYHEDCELGYRLKSYHRNIYYNPSAEIIHFGGSSSSNYKLETYRENFKSLLYVMSKYNNMLNAVTIRVAIISGMLIRLFLSTFGMYRDIDKVSIYNNASDATASKLKMSDVNKTYIQIIKDCLCYHSPSVLAKTESV